MKDGRLCLSKGTPRRLEVVIEVYRQVVQEKHPYCKILLQHQL